jgi:hypothetical protein
MTPAYTVFMDESFDGFMNLTRDDGYFCYAALMVPTERLPDLSRFWAANRDRLIAAYKQATGFELQGEFKSGALKKLSIEARRSFGQKLCYFLRKNRCFVAGFYTTVRSMLLYRLRTRIALDDEAKELPADFDSLLEGIKNEFLEEKPDHPGEAALLLGLFHQTVSITMHWLGSGKLSFTVVYDPRQKREDRFLIQHSDDWLRKAAEVENMTGLYMGTSNALASSASPGLMLVDLILRDVRFLFQDVPELLTEHSGPRLILPDPEGCDPVGMELRGIPLMWGSRRPMSEGLRRKLLGTTSNSMLPLYLESLAGGKLSCNAALGESRVVNFGEWAFEDMVD